MDEAGAEVNTIDRWGSTPLDEAVRSGHSSAKDFLIQHSGLTGAVLASNHKDTKTFKEKVDTAAEEMAELFDSKSTELQESSNASAVDSPISAAAASKPSFGSLRKSPTSLSNNNFFTCPLSGKKFTDPVIAKDGYTYDRHAIVSWWHDNSPCRSPMTGEQLRSEDLIPNLLISRRLAKPLSQSSAESTPVIMPRSLPLKELRVRPEPIDACAKSDHLRDIVTSPVHRDHSTLLFGLMSPLSVPNGASYPARSRADEEDWEASSALSPLSLLSSPVSASKEHPGPTWGGDESRSPTSTNRECRSRTWSLEETRSDLLLSPLGSYSCLSEPSAVEAPNGESPQVSRKNNKIFARPRTSLTRKLRSMTSFSDQSQLEVSDVGETTNNASIKAGKSIATEGSTGADITRSLSCSEQPIPNLETGSPISFFSKKVRMMRSSNDLKHQGHAAMEPSEINQRQNGNQASKSLFRKRDSDLIVQQAQFAPNECNSPIKFLTQKVNRIRNYVKRASFEGASPVVGSNVTNSVHERIMAMDDLKQLLGLTALIHQYPDLELEITLWRRIAAVYMLRICSGERLWQDMRHAKLHLCKLLVKSGNADEAVIILRCQVLGKDLMADNDRVDGALVDDRSILHAKAVLGRALMETGRTAEV